MDQIDRAQQLEEAERENALRAARCSISPLPSKAFCESCDEPIPKARQRAISGIAVCIECQKMEEDRAKQSR